MSVKTLATTGPNVSPKLGSRNTSRSAGWHVCATTCKSAPQFVNLSRTHGPAQPLVENFTAGPSLIMVNTLYFRSKCDLQSYHKSSRIATTQTGLFLQPLESWHMLLPAKRVITVETSRSHSSWASSMYSSSKLPRREHKRPRQLKKPRNWPTLTPSLPDILLHHGTRQFRRLS